MANVSMKYATTATTTCTDTTQASCRDNQALHTNLKIKLAEANASAEYDKDPHVGGEARTIAGGGGHIDTFVSPPLAIRISWMSLLTAGSLLVLYGLVKR
jgi:hypothetical protein